MSITPKQQKQIYTWKNGFSSTKGIDAEVVVNEVNRIERAWGICTPHHLVSFARPEDSPIHGLFNWDDQDAAERFRVFQARRILSSIRIVVDEADEPVPAYVHVRTVTDEGHEDKYASIMHAMSDPDSRGSVLREALMFLQGYRKRYAMLSELAIIWHAIDEATNQYERQAL